jgi:hypothetical protein
MSQHDAFLDRMTARLAEVERQIKALGQDVQGTAAARELETGLVGLRERLQTLRRAGPELTEDMTTSFAQAFERLNAAVGRARAGGGRPDAA